MAAAGTLCSLALTKTSSNELNESSPRIGSFSAYPRCRSEAIMILRMSGSPIVPSSA